MLSFTDQLTILQDDWTGEESLAGSSVRGGGPGEDDDFLEMIYGQGVPPELLAESATNRPSVDQIDDDERMKDPQVLIDIRVSDPSHRLPEST